MRTKQMKTINNITPFLARFFYLITYKILGLFTYLKSHSEITLINAFQLGSTIAGIQSVLNKCRPHQHCCSGQQRTITQSLPVN